MTPGVENFPMLTCARRNVRPQVPSVQNADGGVFDGCCQYYNLTHMTIELTHKHAVLPPPDPECSSGSIKE
jgi:hypothetical protein